MLHVSVLGSLAVLGGAPECGCRRQKTRVLLAYLAVTARPPTLVLHCCDDASIPFEQGRLIANRIPRARFVALESRNHVLLPRDPAWVSFVGEVRRLLRECAPTTSRA